MKQVNQQEFVQQLIQDIQELVEIVEQQFAQASTEQLNWKANPNSWSVLECLEHLNRYSDFYHREIQQKIAKAATEKSSTSLFKPSWLGNYFVDSVAPNNQKAMKTFKRMNPGNSQLLADTVIENFLAHQVFLIQLVEKSESLNWNKIKVPLEFFKLIHLRLGDVFRFLVAHSQRHIIQASKAFEAYTEYEKNSRIKSLS